MPKIVDHDQRRAELVRLIIRVIAEKGLSDTTVRSISRAGGFTSGVLSHYFVDKDEMIKFAFGAVADMIFERINERLQKARGLDRIRIIIEEHLPLNAHDDETAVALAFWEVAMHDPNLRSQYKSNYGRWREYLRREISTLRPELPPSEVKMRVDLAIAATDGLLVTFALDRDAYGRHRRTAILNRMLEMLGLES